MKQTAFASILYLIINCLIINCPSLGLAQEEVDAPLPPSEAARTMRVPEGVHVTLFAGEPDVMQPIGFCIDDRRRLWVAEAFNYPERGNNRDRIIILTDSDGDGQHDDRKVFFEGLGYVTGIEVGFGGAWVVSPPNLYFIPDRDGDDVPDGPPEIVLDGFGNHANAHNIANGLAWGPDGWLYGTHGRTNWSMIGKPGASDAERTRFDGGVYRYHPVRRIWESYADGSTNPWGIDWNDFGAAFVCNCVNPHLFQVIQGAHYEPWRGRESSQYAYQRIDTIADHLHFVGLKNVQSGLGSAEEDAAGGGHAHCGTMIYLGDNFPVEYRNTLFTNNIHGRRINNDILKRKGSGYVASHGPDLMRSLDQWFMGVTLAYGPAGEIYVSDWSDTGECHSIRNTRRSTGRIYRLTYGEVVAPAVDLAELADLELVELQWHANDWYVRHARRQLQERAARGAAMNSVHKQLLHKFSEPGLDVPRRLRALWVLHVTGGLDERLLLQCLSHASEYVRGWAVTLLCETGQPTEAMLQRCVEMSHGDKSPLVRLSLACALQRLSPSHRWELASGLASRHEDETDQNLPLMIWYGCEPLVHADLRRFEALIGGAEISQVRINGARRIMDSDRRDDGLELLMQRLGDSPGDDDRDGGARCDELAADLLEGILQGTEGERRVAMPKAWPAAYERLAKSASDAVRDRAVSLAVLLDDQQALASLQRVAHDTEESVASRQRAIKALVAKRLPGWDAELIELLSDPPIRSDVLRSLAAFHHADTPRAVLQVYAELSASDRQTALLTLAGREGWALELLNAIEARRVPAEDLTAFPVRVMRELGNDLIDNKLNVLWGAVRESPRERTEQIAQLKTWLDAPTLASANRVHGSELFVKHCAACHKFFGQGGDIGPDITGAQRQNLDYLLENIIDPNAAVSKDYQMEILRTVDDRIVTGLVEATSAETLVVQTLNERVVLPLEEIVERMLSRDSIMPQGLLDGLSDEEIRDLIAYVQFGPLVEQ